MPPSSYQRYNPIWEKLLAMRDLFPLFYREALQQAIVAQELTNLPLGMLIHAYDVYPIPLTAQMIQACVPYYHTAPFTERMVKIAKAGLFQTTDNQHYALTEDAYRRVDMVYQSIYTAIGQLDVLAATDLDWLVMLIQGMLERSLAGVSPTPAAMLEYKPERTHAIQPLAKFAASVDVLFNFRCDAHQAAWHRLAISPPAVEVWTLIWRGEANTVQGVVDVLTNDFPRGYSLTEYQAFTNELVQQDWLVSEDGIHYQLTETGQTQRDAIEDETNRLFYAAWESLTNAEVVRLDELATQLLNTLKKLAETRTPA